MFVLSVALPLSAAAAPLPPTSWVGSWARPLLPAAANRTHPELADATIRVTVRLSAGGSAVRLRFSNAFGTVGRGISMQ